MCLEYDTYYSKRMTARLSKAKTKKLTFYKTLTLETNHYRLEYLSVITPFINNNIRLVDGYLVSNRGSTTMTFTESIAGIEKGIHVYTKKRGDEGVVFTIPVLGRLNDFIGADRAGNGIGSREAVFMKVKIDPKLVLKKAIKAFKYALKANVIFSPPTLDFKLFEIENKGKVEGVYGFLNKNGSVKITTKPIEIRKNAHVSVLL